MIDLPDSNQARPFSNTEAVWAERWKAGEFEPPVTPANWKVGQFFILLNECMGTPPMCFSDYTMPAAFEDARDAVAYYRHTALPRLLAILTNRPEDGPRDPAEGYLGALDEELRGFVVEFLACLDQVLAAPAIEAADLERVFDTLNATFCEPPVESQVKAHGTIADVLANQTYAGALAEDIDETEPDTLGSIWASGRFDPGDPKHFSLAVDFLESHTNY